MKKLMIISLLSLSALGSYAQSFNDDDAAKRRSVHEKALEVFCKTNGNMGLHTHMVYNTNYSKVHHAYPDAPMNAVPAWPSGNYTALQYPPCYTYKDSRGKSFTVCPGASFGPRQCGTAEAAQNQIEQNNIGAQSESSFTGNYPDLRNIYPEAPVNAVPAWPKSSYKELKNPPCYKYINKRGLEVTECPGAQFDAEK
jgi:hypothetical protein